VDHFAMLNAEELGVTKANVDEMLKSDNPEIKRLLGTEASSARRSAHQ
jgi:general L-amino acid transport system substrate-binding protein